MVGNSRLALMAMNDEFADRYDDRHSADDDKDDSAAGDVDVDAAAAVVVVVIVSHTDGGDDRQVLAFSSAVGECGEIILGVICRLVLSFLVLCSCCLLCYSGVSIVNSSIASICFICGTLAPLRTF